MVAALLLGFATRQLELHTLKGVFLSRDDGLPIGVAICVAIDTLSVGELIRARVSDYARTRWQ